MNLPKENTRQYKILEAIRQFGTMSESEIQARLSGIGQRKHIPQLLGKLVDNDFLYEHRGSYCLTVHSISCFEIKENGMVKTGVSNWKPLNTRDMISPLVAERLRDFHAVPLHASPEGIKFQGHLRLNSDYSSFKN